MKTKQILKILYWIFFMTLFILILTQNYDDKSDAVVTLLYLGSVVTVCKILEMILFDYFGRKAK